MKETSSEHMNSAKMIVLKGLPQHSWDFLAVQGSLESPKQNKNKNTPPPQTAQTTDILTALGKKNVGVKEKGKKTYM